MVKVYRVTFLVRLINRLMKMIIGWGVAPKHIYMLTVPGRKSGEPHSNPVAIVQQSGQRWLVAPYGEVNWVKNARAAGEVTLSRGRKSERFQIEETDAETRAPILRTYVALEPITRRYFDARADSPMSAFVAEAERHPVFRLIPIPDES